MLVAAGTVAAQKAKAPAENSARPAPAPALYERNVQIKLPEDRTSVNLPGVHSVRIAWILFSQFDDGSTSQEPQVLTLMEGATVKWSGPKSCSYDLALVGSPPALTMTKNPKICALRQGATATFKVVAM